ncbi:FGGY-family carbohydrate kinase [Candidatus Sumerlaeota bacterium]|nr:FGGY-family carbohydrate kinase [Candidatus Sumerlaeota bacterium]
MKKEFCIGIDVGTGSVRAGIFSLKGKMISAATVPIKMWKPQTDFVEQSSDNIWKSACEAVETAMKQGKLNPNRIAGVSFDATCSLVCLDNQNRPLTVSPSGKNEQNVIVWMDHRAIDQVERINATHHKVLKYVGGVMSPEMEPPKLLWLKENMKSTWKNAGKYFDLADFMTFRATGKDVRSLCTVVCKWTYQGHLKSPRPDSIGAWDASFWKSIGLEDLSKNDFEKIGKCIRPMGEAIGNGLTEKAAADFGLSPGTPVGVGIIDAHAGGLGMLGAELNGKKPTPKTLEARLALIGGTSTCHMAVSREPLFIRGIWGPYYSAMIPGMWLTEGGQGATGSLVDFSIFSNRLSSELEKEAKKSGKTVYEILNLKLDELSKHLPFPASLTSDRHVLPYHHGNRSPRANPTLKGVQCGMKLDMSINEMAQQYLATIQGIAYGARHIIEEMNAKGYNIKTLFACGGGTKNPVFVREHADATGCEIVIPKEPEAVLLGSAILGAVASGAYPDILSAMAYMNQPGKVIQPSKGGIAQYHAKKYQVFKAMYEDFMKYRKIMAM